MNKQEIKEFIDQKIEQHCETTEVEFSSLNRTTGFNLLESGVYDSMDFLELVTTVEEEFDIELDLSEHEPEEFTNYIKLLDIIVDINN